MIEYVSKDDVSRIVEIEERALDEYRRVLDQYAAMFRKFNAVLDVQLSWKNAKEDVLYNERPAIIDGYNSFVTCAVRGADGAIIESMDHDMYMDFAWFVSICEKGVVCIDDSVDDELFSLMECCMDYFLDPY